MATIKSFTDLEQSRKLAGVLPIESADMHYIDNHYDPLTLHLGFCNDLYEEYKSDKWDYIPCWSLTALLEQLPYELCDDDGNSLYLEINKEDNVYQLVYADPYGNFESIETDRYEHFVDACYEMIIKLKELNLL